MMERKRNYTCLNCCEMFEAAGRQADLPKCPKCGKPAVKIEHERIGGARRLPPKLQQARILAVTEPEGES